MGVFDRDYMRSEKPGLRMPHTWVWRLILLCGVIWFVQMAARHWVDIDVDPWFGLSLHGLARGKLWTVLTYAFLHADFGHLLWNCFGIWVFGAMLERSMSRTEFARLTFWAAIAGGLGYLLGDVVMGSGRGYVIGASGILSGYLALAALRYPKTPIRLLFLPFFSFPLWLLAVIFFAGDILGAGSHGGSNVAYWAHLGGAAYGLVVFRFGVLPRWSLPRLRIGSADGSGRPAKPTRAEKKSDAERTRVDELLDKISRDGIGSLTDAERKFLNDASKRYSN